MRGSPETPGSGAFSDNQHFPTTPSQMQSLLYPCLSTCALVPPTPPPLPVPSISCVQSNLVDFLFFFSPGRFSRLKFRLHPEQYLGLMVGGGIDWERTFWASGVALHFYLSGGFMDVYLCNKSFCSTL